MLVDKIYTVELRGLSYHAYHGVLPEERERGQAFVVDLSLTYEPGTLGDQLSRALDYAAVAAAVERVVCGEPVDLIETLADRIGRRLLDQFPILLAADVSVHKPQAPLQATFDDVIVRRSLRRVVTAYLGMGSNLGDRRSHLQSGLRFIAQHPQVALRQVSHLYETEPVGVTDQPAFYNAAAAIQTTLAPSALLAVCKRAEAAVGRVPGARWGPRVLDIDILLYGGLQLTAPYLQIPHAALAEREFALRPLLDIDPALQMPSGAKLVDLLNGLERHSAQQVEDDRWALKLACGAKEVDE